MKRFYIYLTFYSLLILSASMLSYYYLLIRPSLGKLETSLVSTATEVNTLGQQVAQIKQTTDRLEARTTTYSPRSAINPLIEQTTLDASLVPPPN